MLEYVVPCQAAPWRKVNIFGIFGVRHTNQGQIKYGIYNANSLFFNCQLVGCLTPSPTCNQTSKLKNQYFFTIHIRFGKMIIFLSLGLVIK